MKQYPIPLYNCNGYWFLVCVSVAASCHSAQSPHLHSNVDSIFCNEPNSLLLHLQSLLSSYGMHSYSYSLPQHFSLAELGQTHPKINNTALPHTFDNRPPPVTGACGLNDMPHRFINAVLTRR